jgi:Protein of unknown function (DUF1348)
VGYPRKSQTVTATPAKPGELSILLEQRAGIGSRWLARPRSVLHDRSADFRSTHSEFAMSPRPPLPPFTPETASQKGRLGDAWNSRDPQRVALAYTEDSPWRNRVEFIEGRTARKSG